MKFRNYARIIIAAICLCCIAQTAEARLGETTKECMKRYGKVVKKDATSLYFVTKTDIIIRTIIVGGKCESIAYVKEEGEEFFTTEQILHLAKVNTGLGEDAWVMSDDDDPQLVSFTAKNKYYLLVDMDNEALIIMTVKQLERLMGEIEKEEAQEIKGL